jgi:hypothetical protein
MPGVDFEKDFPQPPAGDARPAGRVPARRIAFRGESPVEIELLNPLVIEGKPPLEFDRLAIRRLTAGEMIDLVEALGEGIDDRVLIRHVTAAMAGIELDVIEALSPDDAGRVAAAALPFMPAGLVAAIERTMTEPAGAAEDAG